MKAVKRAAMSLIGQGDVRCAARGSKAQFTCALKDHTTLHYTTLPPRVEVERMRIAIAKRSRITLAGELPLTKREGM